MNDFSTGGYMHAVTEVLMRFIGLISIGILILFGIVVMALHYHMDDEWHGRDKR